MSLATATATGTIGRPRRMRRPCEADANGNGICDDAEITGCTDASAYSFNASATDEDNSCTYAEEGDCETCVEGNVVVNDADSDRVCDSDEAFRLYRSWPAMEGFTDTTILNVFMPWTCGLCRRMVLLMRTEMAYATAMKR